MQKAAEKALGKRQGAVVAINPNNGAVLVMVSHPTFDPNIFSTRVTPEIWKKLQSEDHPFVIGHYEAFLPPVPSKLSRQRQGWSQENSHQIQS